MNVKITSDKHGHAKVLIDGEEAKGLLSLHLAVGMPNTVTMVHAVNQVQFEGEAQVIAIINGRAYRLIEETAADET